MINLKELTSSFQSKVLVVFAAFLLAYLLIPIPSSINSFPALPNSVKSTLSGDTVQVPNVTAYFSDNYRQSVIPFYRSYYQNQTIFPFPSLRLNYPPEFAYTAIKDQTHSTYLEEFIYPLKGSLYVNGLEPFYEDGQPRYFSAIPFDIGKDIFETKVTLRLYTSSILARIIVWVGILVSIVFIWRLGKKIVFS